ncbi:hypothetical protein B0H14DRAFT_2602837 [Mycena olivaceomarginata]|nr:hypothetical protein B0H14DRAFT_2602837 [Mycena olivaceomarginata]
MFSSFINGSTTTDENCFPRADGRPGVSCAVEWNGVYGRTYDFEVKYAGRSSLWIRTVVDTVTGQRVHIGSYTVPSGAGGIMDSQLGFVEWYPWNVETPPNHCAHPRYQHTIFGTPRTTHRRWVGSQSVSFEYGNCVGEVAFKTQGVDGELENQCGFRGQTGL